MNAQKDRPTVAGWCPRNCGRPSRRMLVNTSGQPALCRICAETRMDRPKKEGRLPVRHRADRTPGEIDKLYRQALQKMRAERLADQRRLTRSGDS